MSKKTAKPNPEPPPAEDVDVGDIDDLDLDNLDGLFEDDDDPAPVLDDDDEEPVVDVKPAKGKGKRLPAVEVEPLGEGPKSNKPLVIEDTDNLAVLPPILDRLSAVEETLLAKVEVLQARVAAMESKLVLQAENVYKSVKSAETALMTRLETLDRFLSAEFGYDDKQRDTILQDIYEAVGAQSVKEQVTQAAEVAATAKNGKKESTKVTDEVKQKLLRIINKQTKPVAWVSTVASLAGHFKMESRDVESALVAIGFEKGEKIQPGKITV